MLRFSAYFCHNFVHLGFLWAIAPSAPWLRLP